MNIAVIISILVFISIVLLISSVYSYFNGRKRSKDLISKIKGPKEQLLLDRDREPAAVSKEGHYRHFHVWISSLGSRLKPKDAEEISGMRMKLVQAGFRSHNAPLVYFGYRAFLAVLFPVIFSLSRVFFVKAVAPGSFMVLTVISAIAGFYLPGLWLTIKTKSRQEKILEGFPDALDLMVVCVEAGMGLDATINRVGEEMKLRNKVISEEFNVLALELRAGKTRRDALKNLGLRTGLEEVKSLITLLIQTDKFGTSIAQALRVHSDSMRTRRYQKAEELAAKLPVKLVFPLILFIFPSLFVVIIGPAAIRIFRILLPTIGGH